MIRINPKMNNHLENTVDTSTSVLPEWSCNTLKKGFTSYFLSSFLSPHSDDLSSFDDDSDYMDNFSISPCSTPDETPDPLLVGIETNPGPPKAKNNNKQPLVNGKPNAKKTYPNSVSIQAPVAKARTRTMNKPKITNLKDGNIRVVHREYFTDVTGSAAFANSQYSINPGLSTMFPWLATIANRYESYIVNKLHFCYETESATSATGTIVLAVDFDASDSAPLSKSDILAYHNAVRSAPWSDCEYKCSPMDKSKMKTYFTRPGTLAANLDIKLYDLGTLNVATIAQSGSVLIGELYVDYDLTFQTPQINSSAILSAKLVATAGLSDGNLFGTDAVVTGSLPFTVTSASTITFNSQVELLGVLSINGTTLSGNLTNSGTCTFTSHASAYPTAATSGIAYFIIRATPGQTFIPDQTAASVTGVFWRFAQYTYSLN